MKKILFAVAAMFTGFGAFAQNEADPELFVIEPSAAEQKVDSLLYNDPSYGWGKQGAPALNLKVDTNGLEGSLIYLQSSDSLGCGPITTSNVAGKIGVLFRGQCSFADKALNAQNAGAIALIVIDSNASFGTLGGTSLSYGVIGGNAVSENVTIPMMMISSTQGEALRPHINAGTCKVFMGNKVGNKVLRNDLISKSGDNAIMPYSKMPKTVLTDSNDIVIPVGTWVRNVGKNTATNVQLNAKITKNGTVVYDVTTQPVASLMSDSVESFLLPDFMAAEFTANAEYVITYTVTSDSTDNDMDDNTFSDKMMVSNEDIDLSYIRLDENGNMDPDFFVTHPASVPDGEACITFKFPKMEESTVKFDHAIINMGGSGIVGKTATVRVYEWNEDDLTDRDEVTSNEYAYTNDSERGQNVLVSLPGDIEVDPSIRYQVCVMPEAGMSTGYDDSRNYLFTRRYNEVIGGDQANFDLPKASLYSASDQSVGFSAGYGQDMIPAIQVGLVGIGVDENEISEKGSAYPNPATTTVTVPFTQDVDGEVAVTVYNNAGQLVKSLNVASQGSSLKLDVSDLKQGLYTMNVSTENGQASTFKLAISK
ncbi:MAG: T9SS type A sorting domain-containing protein [Flavobacteriales bacterium]|jgi:hypothetical protein|nr:T9SS type A sorting domain-containing protein [Flavobacteriales bacterium]